MRKGRLKSYPLLRYIYIVQSARKEYVATVCYRLSNGWKSEVIGLVSIGTLKRTG